MPPFYYLGVSAYRRQGGNAVTKEEQLKNITDQYLPAFLGFAISKTGNFAEAEELAQEIAFQCVLAIDQGKIKRNFNAYIWSIAHNTLKRWCSRRRPILLDDQINCFTNVLSPEVPVVDRIIGDEERDAIRLGLRSLSATIARFLSASISRNCP